MSVECSIVIPLCNEEKNLPTLHLRLMAVMQRLAVPYEIIYVDDGSSDATPRMITELYERETESVKAVFLSRNFGHQAALCAGLEAATGRAVITLDGDLQDPPELIPDLLARWHDGYKIVYARRRRRRDNPFKLAACYLFYRCLRRMSDTPIPLDTGDYALMDRQVVEQLNGLPERTRFIRGLRSWVGFKQVDVLYDRDRRRDGESKYSFTRLARLGLDGVFAFSDTPLKMITLVGLLVCMGTLAGIGFKVIGRLEVGWSVWSLFLLGGVQLVALGVIGEYLARIHQEVRGRPLYITREKLGFHTMPRPAPNILEFLSDKDTAHQEITTASQQNRSWPNDRLL